MLKLNLILRKKSDELMIFSPPPWFRILFLLIAAVLISGIIIVVTDSGEQNFTVSAIITFICIIAALYEESWTFNKAEQKIVYKTGIVFLYKSRSYSFAEVENFELVTFIRGMNSNSTRKSQETRVNPFSRETSSTIPGFGQKKNYPNYHQELRLNLKSEIFVTIESQDVRRTEVLAQNVLVLSDFCGIHFINH